MRRRVRIDIAMAKLMGRHSLSFRDSGPSGAAAVAFSNDRGAEGVPSSGGAVRAPSLSQNAEIMRIVAAGKLSLHSVLENFERNKRILKPSVRDDLFDS